MYSYAVVMASVFRTVVRRDFWDMPRRYFCGLLVRPWWLAGKVSVALGKDDVVWLERIWREGTGWKGWSSWD